MQGDHQESSPDRERDGLTARNAPGRSGVPSTWLTRVRWAAWRVRTAARLRPGLTGGRPRPRRPGLGGVHRGPGALPPGSGVISPPAAGPPVGVFTGAPPGGVAALELGDDLRPGGEPAVEDLHGRAAERA